MFDINVLYHARHIADSQAAVAGSSKVENKSFDFFGRWTGGIGLIVHKFVLLAIVGRAILVFVLASRQSDAKPPNATASAATPMSFKAAILDMFSPICSILLR